MPTAVAAIGRAVCGVTPLVFASVLGRTPHELVLVRALLMLPPNLKPCVTPKLQWQDFCAIRIDAYAQVAIVRAVRASSAFNF